MNNFSQKAISLLLCVSTLCAMFSCESSGDDTTLDSDPTIVSLSIVDGSITDSQASIKVEVKKAERVYYALEEGSKIDFDQNTAAFKASAYESGASEVIIELSSLTIATDYVVGVYAEGDITKSAVKCIEFSTADQVIEEAKVPTIQLAISDDKKSVIATLTDAAKLFYSINPISSEAEEWTEVNTIGSNSCSIDISLLEAGEYTVSAYAVSDKEVESEVTTLDVTVEEEVIEQIDSYFEITDIKVSPISISMNVDINELGCEMIAFTAVPTADYSSAAFLEGFTTGYVDTIIREDGAILYNNGGFNLTPNTSYTIAAIAIEVASETEGAWEQIVYTYSTLGDIFETEITTEPFEIGASDAAVTLTADEATATFNSLNITISNDNEASGYILGYADSSIIGGDVMGWITSSELLTNPYTYISYLDENGSATEQLAGLTFNTDYTIFAIGVSADGFLGAVSSITASTMQIEDNNDIEYSLSVKTKTEEATFEMTFGEQCSKIYYYNSMPGEYNDAQMKETMLRQITSAKNFVSLQDATDGVYSLTLKYLKTETNYILYTIATDESGAISEMKKIEYTTNSLTYSAEASLTLTEKEVSRNAYGNTVVTLDVEMTNGAVKYVYAVIDDYVTDKSNINAYGDAAIKAWDKRTSTSPTIDITLYNSTYLAVFIPVDEDGNYGTPVKYTYSGW